MDGSFATQFVYSIFFCAGAGVGFGGGDVGAGVAGEGKQASFDSAETVKLQTSLFYGFKKKKDRKQKMKECVCSTYFSNERVFGFILGPTSYQHLKRILFIIRAVFTPEKSVWKLSVVWFKFIFSIRSCWGIHLLVFNLVVCST